MVTNIVVKSIIAKMYTLHKNKKQNGKYEKSKNAKKYKKINQVNIYKNFKKY